ncbi:MAG: molybdopterin dinucleotide binding domain-containing protein [Geminicoccaceae bacterium]
MAPRDAAARAIADGTTVRLFNERVRASPLLRLDPGLREGVLVMPTGAWFEPDRTRPGLEINGNPNVLTSRRTTSALGQGCAALSTLVRIEVRDGAGTMKGSD